MANLKKNNPFGVWLAGCKESHYFRDGMTHSLCGVPRPDVAKKPAQELYTTKTGRCNRGNGPFVPPLCADCRRLNEERWCAEFGTDQDQ